MSPSFEELVAALNSVCGGKGGGYRSVSFILPVSPMPAPRARTTRDGYSYSPKPYVTWRGQCKKHIPSLEPIISGLRCGIAVSLVMPPYKTVKTPWPKGDNDNYEKAVWDIITKGGAIWKDDVQVTTNVTSKRFTNGDETPHVQVYIREIL